MQSARDALNKKIKVSTQTIKEKVSKDATKTREPPEFLHLQQQLKLTRTTVRWLRDLSKPVFVLKATDANPIVQFNREVEYGEKARQAYQIDRRHMDSLEVEKDKSDLQRQRFEEAKTTYAERKESFTMTAQALLRRRDEQYKSTIDGMVNILRSTFPKWHVAKARSETVMVSPGAFITPPVEQGPIKHFFCGCRYDDENGPVTKFCEFHEENDTMKSLTEAYVSRQELVSPPECLRYEIFKYNKMGVKKMRHIQLMVKDLALRSFEEGGHKDYPFAEITGFEKSIEDDVVFSITLQSSRKVTFHFANAAARAQFLPLFYWMRNLQRTVQQTGCHILPHPIGKLTIFTGTWNVGQGAAATQSLAQWLPNTNCDMYVVAFQECGVKEREIWQSKIKAHIQHQAWDKSVKGAKPPKPPSNAAGSGGGDSKEEEEPYVVLGCPVLWECSIWVLIKREHYHRVSAVQNATVACGVGGVLGNKGGAGLSFRIEETSLCFIGAHLAARGERVMERQQNHVKILKELGFGEKGIALVHQFDHVFFLGDLNYRVELTFDEAKACIAKKDYQALLDSDQLANERKLDNVFVGFDEGPIAFAPTYRWEKQKNELSFKRGQPPSYTDRVLWHSRDGTMLKQQKYDSAPDIFGSDHRAVYATFVLTPQPIAFPNALVNKHCQLRAQKLQLHLYAPLIESCQSVVLQFRCAFVERKEASGGGSGGGGGAGGAGGGGNNSNASSGNSGSNNNTSGRTEPGVPAIEDQRLEWMFNDRIQMATTIADVASLAHTSLLVSVYGSGSSTHKPLGTATIPLFPLFQASASTAANRLVNSSQFMVTALHDGKAIGQITGLLEAMFSGSEPAKGARAPPPPRA